jgi:hypothetical protein
MDQGSTVTGVPSSTEPKKCSAIVVAMLDVL